MVSFVSFKANLVEKSERMIELLTTYWFLSHIGFLAHQEKLQHPLAKWVLQLSIASVLSRVLRSLVTLRGKMVICLQTLVKL